MRIPADTVRCSGSILNSAHHFRAVTATRTRTDGAASVVPVLSERSGTMGRLIGKKEAR